MPVKHENVHEEQDIVCIITIDSAVCCVCHNGEEKDVFVVACKCSGTMKYHEDCIKKSIIQRKTVNCPNCKTDYYGAFANNLKDFATGYVVNLRRLQENSHPESNTNENTVGYVPNLWVHTPYTDTAIARLINNRSHRSEHPPDRLRADRDVNDIRADIRGFLLSDSFKVSSQIIILLLIMGIFIFVLATFVETKRTSEHCVKYEN